MTLTRPFSAMVLTLLCIFALSAVAKADTITFTATLSGKNEVPERATNATGTATVVLDTVTGKGTITVSFSGLTAAVTNGGAHIHCCTLPTANAGVIVPFYAGITLTNNSTAGSTTNFAFTLAPVGSLTVADQIAGMLNGLSYVNIHTTTYPGGEIRGQLYAVPEPGTFLLLGGGLLSLTGVLRKRRKRDE